MFILDAAHTVLIPTADKEYAEVLGIELIELYKRYTGKAAPTSGRTAGSLNMRLSMFLTALETGKWRNNKSFSLEKAHIEIADCFNKLQYAEISPKNIARMNALDIKYPNT